MYVGIISNCKYWKFIKLVLVLVLLFIVVRTQYCYVSFVTLFYYQFIYRCTSHASALVVPKHSYRTHTWSISFH